MSNRLKTILPWLALVSGLLAVLGIFLLSVLRADLLADTGETLSIVEASLEPLLIAQPESIDDPDLMVLIEDVAASPHVATLWLLNPNGEVIHSTGATSQSFFQGTAQDYSSTELARILSALPDGALSNEQRMLLHVASAIQREGEHNDIYGHIVREIRAPAGSLTGLIGIAYQVSPEEAGLGWKMLVLASILGVIGYWLALPIWTLLDGKQRGERAWAWAVFVLLGNLMALLAYLLTRAPKSADAT
jgi:hypothetical protein